MVGVAADDWPRPDDCLLLETCEDSLRNEFLRNEWVACFLFIYDGAKVPVVPPLSLINVLNSFSSNRWVGEGGMLLRALERRSFLGLKVFLRTSMDSALLAQTYYSS